MHIRPRGPCAAVISRLAALFLALALSAGLDSAICDPTDPDIQGILYAARALLGEDELCGEYLRAYRSGRFC